MCGQTIRSAVAAILAGILLATPASAEEAQQSGKQGLEQAASDPTASLMSFQIGDFYAPTLHNLDGESRNYIQFRAAIPFEALGQSNIARLTVPVVTHSPFADEGLGDSTLFDLLAFDRSWGRLGAGAVALLPTGGQRGAEKWALGPAVGFVARTPELLAGAFNQNLITVGGDNSRRDVMLSTLQPILSHSLGDGWSVGTSDMTVVYDWDRSEFSSLPLGVKVSKLTRDLGLPLQIQLAYERNFADDGFGPQDTVSLNFKLLVPK